MSTFTEDDSSSVIINSHYNANLNETAFFFLYTTFSQLFPFAEMIRRDKNDLISLAALLFLVAVTSKTSKHCLLAVLVGYSV